MNPHDTTCRTHIGGACNCGHGHTITDAQLTGFIASNADIEPDTHEIGSNDLKAMARECKASRRTIADLLTTNDTLGKHAAEMESRSREADDKAAYHQSKEDFERESDLEKITMLAGIIAGQLVSGAGSRLKVDVNQLADQALDIARAVFKRAKATR